jgi:hypothetical protein
MIRPLLGVEDGFVDEITRILGAYLADGPRHDLDAWLSPVFSLPTRARSSP